MGWTTRPFGGLPGPPVNAAGDFAMAGIGKMRRGFLDGTSATLKFTGRMSPRA